MSKTSKGIKFLNQKRNLKKETSNNNLYKENINKKNLNSYEELMGEAKIMIEHATTIVDLEKCIKKYDVDENINLKYLTKIHDINEEKGFEEFMKYKYTLKYEDRDNLKKTYIENLLKVKSNYLENVAIYQEDKLEKVFFNLLKYIIEEKNLNLSQLFGSFCKEFYVDTLEYKIPIIYGNDELFFAHLINSFYNFFIINKSYPILTLESKIDLSNIKIKKRESSMIMKLTKREKELKANEEKEVVPEFVTNVDANFSSQDEQKFFFKLIEIKPLIEKYISNDFQNDFKDMINSISDKEEKKKIKYKFLSFFELSQYLLLNLVKSPDKNELSNMNDFFYEEKSIKIKVLKEMNKILKINFYYNDKTPIDLDNFEIKNMEYYFEINNILYSINFNDYVLNWVLYDMIKIKDQQYNLCFSNIRNFSLQGCIKNNRCFNDVKVFNSFMEDFDKTLNNFTLKETFECILPFQNYYYPYFRKKFRDQLKEILLYIPFLNNDILGVTFRNLGLIIINQNIFNLEKTNNINKAFSTALLNSSFGKVTTLHETNFHYILKIISSQDEEITCKTPCKYYKNYRFKENEIVNSKKYDGGDFGEALIFGEKIYEIFLPGAEKIFDINFWRKKNINFENLGNEFIKLNRGNKDYQKDLKKLSDFTIILHSYIENELKKYNNSIDNTQINLGDISVRMRFSEKIFDFEEKNLGQLSLKKNRNIPDVVD